MLHPLTLVLAMTAVEPCEPLAYLTKTDALVIERHSSAPTAPTELCLRDQVTRGDDRGDDNDAPDPQVIFTDRDKRVTLLPNSRFVVRPVESCGASCWINRVLGMAEALIGDDKKSISASVAMLPSETSDPYATDLILKSHSISAISADSAEAMGLPPFDVSAKGVNLNAPVFNVPAHLNEWRIPMDAFAIDRIQIIDSSAKNPFTKPLWTTTLENPPAPLASAVVPMAAFRDNDDLRLFIQHRDGLSMHRINFAPIDRSLLQASTEHPQLAAQLLEANALRWSFYTATLLEENYEDLAHKLYFGGTSQR